MEGGGAATEAAGHRTGEPGFPKSSLHRCGSTSFPRFYGRLVCCAQDAPAATKTTCRVESSRQPILTTTARGAVPVEHTELLRSREHFHETYRCWIRATAIVVRFFSCKHIAPPSLPACIPPYARSAMLVESLPSENACCACSLPKPLAVLPSPERSCRRGDRARRVPGGPAARAREIVFSPLCIRPDTCRFGAAAVVTR